RFSRDWSSDVCSSDLERVKPFAKVYYHDVEKEAMRQMILNEQIRLDGRNPKEIRPIWCEVDYLPGTHGSAVFTRGETQSLTALRSEERRGGKGRSARC